MRPESCPLPADYIYADISLEKCNSFKLVLLKSFLPLTKNLFKS